MTAMATPTASSHHSQAWTASISSSERASTSAPSILPSGA